MKNFTIIFLLALTVAGCKGPQGDKAEVTDAKETATASAAAVDHTIDIEASLVTWVGSKPAGRHNGTINISQGLLKVENGAISSGSFLMDMKTVQATDEGLDAEKNAQLTGHLRSEDFFSADQYPSSTFAIVSVDDIATRTSGDVLKLEGATHYVTGNLTLKDSTKAISFPAIITIDDSGVTATALFNIDRTKWGMHYKSDKSFGNQIIHPQVEVGFNIKTK